MSQPINEDAIESLMKSCLLAAIRRQALRTLNEAEALSAGPCQRVERLMRMALTLLGLGRMRVLSVQIHGLRPRSPQRSQSVLIPELMSVPLTDVLAARASDDLHDALQGDAEARRRIVETAEHLLDTENIQLLA